jgi:hypothetical protein
VDLQPRATRRAVRGGALTLTQTLGAGGPADALLRIPSVPESTISEALAEFDWQERDGLPRHITARGDEWSAEARLLWSGPRVPLWMRTHQTQIRADGSVIAVPLRSRGVGRVARIEVRSEGRTLPSWLLSGVHLGIAIERAVHRILPAVE